MILFKLSLSGVSVLVEPDGRPLEGYVVVDRNLVADFHYPSLLSGLSFVVAHFDGQAPFKCIGARFYLLALCLEGNRLRRTGHCQYSAYRYIDPASLVVIDFTSDMVKLIAGFGFIGCFVRLFIHQSLPLIIDFTGIVTLSAVGWLLETVSSPMPV